MTWRVPPYDRALDELVTYVRATYQPLGIVVAGSIVRGEAGPTSDFDVFIVHDASWRLREQRVFAGVPAELFVNPAARVRRYFENEHARGRPCTAHMFATGEALEPVHSTIAELIAEARTWLAKPLEVTEAALVQRRYGAVDCLDDARDVIDRDPAAAALLLAEVVREIVAYAFWQRRAFEPRRKDMVARLEAIDPEAASLLRTWSAASGRQALAIVETLARHVLGVDAFFEWTSERDEE
ncbi:MAG TPA: nucleotidyltransferase domain-containing protein [Kofleriaceae bacterium]|nr:nucleotidyltransferase domain-containing protein [Kofleriaceae bacterium]